MQKKIKTKFPAARIKRIMRLDEEVGKVAQVTPFLIAKAVEVFLTSLVKETLEEAVQRGAKKITPAHLKKVVMETEQFDFCKDLVEGISDQQEPVKEKQPRKKKAKVEAE